MSAIKVFFHGNQKLFNNNSQIITTFFADLVGTATAGHSLTGGLNSDQAHRRVLPAQVL
jgi:hypothetical protein